MILSSLEIRRKARIWLNANFLQTGWQREDWVRKALVEAIRYGVATKVVSDALWSGHMQRQGSMIRQIREL